MKKTLIGLGLALLALCFIMGHLSYSMAKQQHEWEERGETFARQHTDIAHIHRVSLYHGEQRYIAVEGENEQGERKIAWFREEGLLVHAESMVELVPAEQIEQKVKQKAPDLTWIRLQAGLDQGKPIWEATYLDPQGRYHYAYYDMKTGQLLRTFHLQQVNG